MIMVAAEAILGYLSAASRAACPLISVPLGTSFVSVITTISFLLFQLQSLLK